MSTIDAYVNSCINRAFQLGWGSYDSFLVGDVARGLAKAANR